MSEGIVTRPLPDVVAECRDKLVEVITEHRRTCPNPKCAEVGNVLAFLAHCLGATQYDLLAMQQLIVRYDLQCKCEFCEPTPPEPKP